MTKRDDSPAILDEIKTELDPIIEEGLKWLEENDKEETNVYKEKQKELEGKVNPLMQKLYSQGGVPTPGSVPDEGEGDDDDTPPQPSASVNNVDELD